MLFGADSVALTPAFAVVGCFSIALLSILLHPLTCLAGVQVVRSSNEIKAKRPWAIRYASTVLAWIDVLVPISLPTRFLFCNNLGWKKIRPPLHCPEYSWSPQLFFRFYFLTSAKVTFFSIILSAQPEGQSCTTQQLVLSLCSAARVCTGLLIVFYSLIFFWRSLNFLSELALKAAWDQTCSHSNRKQAQ